MHFFGQFLCIHSIEPVIFGDPRIDCVRAGRVFGGIYIHIPWLDSTPGVPIPSRAQDDSEFAGDLIEDMTQERTGHTQDKVVVDKGLVVDLTVEDEVNMHKIGETLRDLGDILLHTPCFGQRSVLSAS